jgi:2-oxoacid dehydrogenases acyltransferase (catalytic domain)
MKSKFWAKRLGMESMTQVYTPLTTRLKPEEFTGGTFTISNLGMFESIEQFTAIVRSVSNDLT